jgi:hypothetical protein
MEKFIENTNSKRHQKQQKWQLPEGFTESMQQRSEDMKERNALQESKYDYHEALDRIQSNARNKLQEIKAEHENHMEASKIRQDSKTDH